MADIIDGATIRMGAKDYTVPPLTFKQLRNLQPKLAMIAAIGGKAVLSIEEMDAMVDVVQAAINRNYPEIARDQLEDLLDLGNLGKIIPVILGVSGLNTSGETGAVNR